VNRVKPLLFEFHIILLYKNLRSTGCSTQFQSEAWPIHFSLVLRRFEDVITCIEHVVFEF